MNVSIKLLIGLSFQIMFFSCSNNATYREMRIDNYNVRAKFTKEGLLDGVVEYYDEAKRLRSIMTYDKGYKSGVAINYNENGTIKDSLYYLANKENGFWYHFDSSGIISFIDNYYFGLAMGPEFYYKNGMLDKYKFLDFHRVTLVACEYDNGGELSKIDRFKMDPIVSEGIQDDKNVKAFFAYLPKVPNTNQAFLIGLTNEQHQDKELLMINSNKVFIDTILPVPEDGWHYFIGCRIKSYNDSIFKYFIEEVVDAERYGGTDH